MTTINDEHDSDRDLMASMSDAAEIATTMTGEKISKLFAFPLSAYRPAHLVDMRDMLDGEMERRHSSLAKEIAVLEHAINGTKPRAPRRDRGTKRAKGEAKQAVLGEVKP